jgi:NADPH-dependent curcumin reductase CurA
MTLTNRQWLLKKRPHADVGPEHFELSITSVPGLDDGQFLVKNQYVSFEPAQRGWLNDLPSYIPPVKVGEVMRAVGVGEVIDSRNADYRIGDRVQGAFGWQDYAVADGRDKVFPVSKIAADIPLTYPLHILRPDRNDGLFWPVRHR